MNEIKLADLALVAHVTPSYLSTKFKKETGISFTEYLVRHRIRKAKKLIKSGNSSFKEVADAVGYHDYVQFSKMFKKYITLVIIAVVIVAKVYQNKIESNNINTIIRKINTFTV